MQAQAYEGYFENGHFYTAGRVVNIPERRRAIITLFDEPIADDEAVQFHKLIDDIRAENEKRGFLSDDEINAEIKAYRNERQLKQV
jgi:hypothetical protein